MVWLAWIPVVSVAGLVVGLVAAASGMGLVAEVPLVPNMWWLVLMVGL